MAIVYTRARMRARTLHDRISDEIVASSTTWGVYSGKYGSETLSRIISEPLGLANIAASDAT